GPNCTVEQVLLESLLVQAYQNAQTIIHKNFLLAHLTSKHASPNMTKMLELLTIQLAKSSPHILLPSRKSHCPIVDFLDKGRETMEKAIQGEADESDETVDAE
ncbi:hypothetical protein BDR04DRAFT_965163, partial [Suillus decipiens]